MIGRPPVSAEERFWKFVNKAGPKVPYVKGKCWIWTAGLNVAGYGKFKLRNPTRTAGAHRVSWEIHRGPIPSGLCVCHRCDVRSCVNPSHLFLGTHLENARDKMKKGRFQNQNGEKNPAAKLTKKDVWAIKRAKKMGMTQKAISAQFKVAEMQISRIIRGQRWANVILD